MKAICPRCRHISYWFADGRADELSPEALRSEGVDDRCEYDGTSTISAPGNELNHNCVNCANRGIIDGRKAVQREANARGLMT